MDTIIYIDGYNLYYGRLRHASYKWLDPFELFRTILKTQKPSSNIIKIKYFTAPVKANFASHGQNQTVIIFVGIYHQLVKSVFYNINLWLEKIDSYYFLPSVAQIKECPAMVFHAALFLIGLSFVLVV